MSETAQKLIKAARSAANSTQARAIPGLKALLSLLADYVEENEAKNG